MIYNCFINTMSSSGGYDGGAFGGSEYLVNGGCGCGGTEGGKTGGGLGSDLVANFPEKDIPGIMKIGRVFISGFLILSILFLVFSVWLKYDVGTSTGWALGVFFALLISLGLDGGAWYTQNANIGSALSAMNMSGVISM